LDPISTVLTKSHYEIILNELVQTAVKKNQKIRIAVCLSKSDLFKMKKTPVQMIRMFFGDVFLHILDSPYIDKEFFSISSIGFMQNVKIVETVEDTNLWNSMKSTEPFFWLFEKTDLEEISMNGSGNILTKGNIIYPPLRKK
jgi:hypothetical protein